MNRKVLTFFSRLLVTVCDIYLAILALWLATWLILGDRLPLLGLVNFLGVYLFLLLPVVLAGILFAPRRRLAIGFVTALLIFFCLFGRQFAPRRWNSPGSVQAASPTLTVMTYNVLAWHQFDQPILDVIRAEDADVVFIQELNGGLAQALHSELGNIYPHQVLHPVDNPSGAGVISKWPLQALNDSLPHTWVGDPILLDMNWDGQTVRLVNFHMISTPRMYPLEYVAQTFRMRNEQAKLLADYARNTPGPIILGGDANSAPMNDAYRILTKDLHDAWSEAGFGLGHTFPGSDIPGSSRPKFGSRSVQQWLARIDYILYSEHWQSVSAHIALFDNVSDHRGVVAVLRIK